jgi:diguanylate cyclase (GGDEF)-like protein
MEFIHGSELMGLPDTTHGALREQSKPGQIALMRKQLPYDLDVGKDYFKVLRRMLEQALATARNAKHQIAKQQVEINRLRKLSITDEHTGLLNRRGFSAALDQAMARAQRYSDPAVLLLIDLDGFKAINDTYGHAAGDLVLSVVADTLKGSVRKLDDVARLGGDEFAVILNKAPQQLAERQANEVANLINGIVVPWSGTSIKVRASVGSHCFGLKTEESAQAVYECADSSMYLKKRRITDEHAPLQVAQ